MSYRSTLRLVCLAGLVFIVSTFPLTGYSTPAAGAVGSYPVFLPLVASGPDVWRPFSNTSPWNVPIPPDAQVDPNSPAMIAQLLTSSDPRIGIDLEGPTIWYADNSTPRYFVQCTLGNCRDMTNVPVPDGAIGAVGTDQHMTVIDPPNHMSYDFYRPQTPVSGSPVMTAAWGTAFDLSGTGVKDRGAASARASGFPLLGGLIRPEEIRAGHINHALIFSYDYPGPCLVYPASTNGGSSKDPRAMPFGAHLQLDPTLDLNTLGLTRSGMVVARALQEYGMYVGDNANTGIYLYAESFNGNIGPSPWVGLLSATEILWKVPASRLRVLKLGPVDCTA